LTFWEETVYHQSFAKEVWMIRNDRENPSGNVVFAYLSGGIVGGICAGFLAAYGESIFLLFTVGAFWVDLSFFFKALALYGAVGAVGGLLCSLLFYFLFFHWHPLRKIRPGIFFFAFLSACGLLAEIVVYLLDIHTFRNLRGGWTAAAYIVLLLDLLTAGFCGWLIAWLGRSFFQGEKRRRLRNGGIALLTFVALFLLARIFITWQEKAGPGQVAGKEGGRPANIIILLVDSLRPDHLSAYGYPLPTSPAIDRLAREGVLYRRCYAASNWTVPTHASLFTGLYPSSHGCYSMYSALDPAIPTLAQILAGKGYCTGSFFDNPLVGSRYGLSRGFQTALGVDNEHKVSLALVRVWALLRGSRSISKNILLAASSWIEYVCKRQRPYFLFFNFLDTHLPYRPQKPYINEFLRSLPAGNVNAELARKFTTDEINTKKAANDLYSRLTAADWHWLERFYDSNIRALDDHIGSFLEYLKNKGLLANTLVIVTADHGEFFGEGGIGGHLHSSMLDAGLRIPLIFWFPERLPPGEIIQTVSQVDLFPTILRLAGFTAAIPSTVQGYDLFALPQGRELLAEFWDDILKRFSRAFYSGDFKLVLQGSGQRELYDLKNDPREKNDLAALRPDLLNSLASRLDERLRSMPQKKSGVDARKKKEMEKLLKSLGYL
jgi:arylsulfatase A-like enzyme